MSGTKCCAAAIPAYSRVRARLRFAWTQAFCGHPGSPWPRSAGKCLKSSVARTLLCATSRQRIQFYVTVPPSRGSRKRGSSRASVAKWPNVATRPVPAASSYRRTKNSAQSFPATCTPRVPTIPPRSRNLRPPAYRAPVRSEPEDRFQSALPHQPRKSDERSSPFSSTGPRRPLSELSRIIANSDSMTQCRSDRSEDNYVLTCKSVTEACFLR